MLELYTQIDEVAKEAFSRQFTREMFLRLCDVAMIEAAMEVTHNKTKAAKRLGMHRNSLARNERKQAFHAAAIR